MIFREKERMVFCNDVNHEMQRECKDILKMTHSLQMHFHKKIYRQTGGFCPSVSNDNFFSWKETVKSESGNSSSIHMNTCTF